MSESLVTQFGAPDAPYCDPETARVTIIPAPLEYSVCYMKGTEHGPQAITLVPRWIIPAWITPPPSR
jgi:agmatinase